MRTVSGFVGAVPWKAAAMYAAATVVGICVGIALALLLVHFTSRDCVEGSSCQSDLYALIAGMALTQAVNLALIYALLRRRGKRHP